MRATIYQWLSEDPELQGLVGSRIYPVNMLNTKPDVPYLVYRLGTATARVVPARTQGLQIWAHDDRGDYGTIDLILARCKVVLESKEGSGSFYEAEWLSDSDDLYDETSATINRFSRFQLILKEA